MSADQNWKDALASTILKIINRRDSEMFRDPVNWQDLGLLDYLDVVQKPMDLGTVRANMRSNKYANAEEAVEDVRLIWRNAQLYNAPGSHVYVKAKTLSDFFEQQWMNFTGDEVNRPPTTTEMQAFARRCYKLDPDSVGKILNQIESACHNAILRKAESNEVEVNLDLIPWVVFRKLDATMQV
jgi:hypothetical protein|tara:strand:+ start:651 stop:1199 length:549 start_codon:yes stop_codon:yes gene_type:complete